MPRIIRSELADRDIFEITRYISQDDMVAADRMVDRFDAVFVKLAEFPELGRVRDELGKNLRSFPVGSYLIFYMPVEDGIEIARVLHGARNLRRLLRKY